MYLVEESEGILYGSDVVEGLVDKLLQRPFELADLHIELDVVTVKLVVVVT